MSSNETLVKKIPQDKAKPPGTTAVYNSSLFTTVKQLRNLKANKQKTNK